VTAGYWPDDYQPDPDPETPAVWAIDDADGTEICSGLSPETAHSTAQAVADRMGETVYLYEIGSPSDPEEISPA
jgi:hypothetical protein